MEVMGWVCLGWVFVAPVITFVIGYKVGQRGLGFKIVKTSNEPTGYAVDG
jgi:hypothetical protein